MCWQGAPGRTPAGSAHSPFALSCIRGNKLGKCMCVTHWRPGISPTPLGSSLKQGGRLGVGFVGAAAGGPVPVLGFGTSHRPHPWLYLGKASSHRALRGFNL